MRSEPYKTFREGRQEASPREYKRRLQIMAERQGWQCAICTRTMNPPTFDHERGRGMGGYRDDRIEDERGWINAALCLACNSLKSSRRYSWFNGQYLPVNMRINGRMDASSPEALAGPNDAKLIEVSTDA